MLSGLEKFVFFLLLENAGQIKYLKHEQFFGFQNQNSSLKKYFLKTAIKLPVNQSCEKLKFMEILLGSL